ncbi:RHS repeat-associated core domain-containing protein [Halomonas sp. TD01]|uniref:RHS repeat-associated core domain-containing protein n=1 Tax=Halomonas sp. TD01 TaxID=999141 RepID=UPI00117CAD50|nr:RHS repeat-associated core domain-containing protein [Halomonas sp. TD01]
MRSPHSAGEQHYQYDALGRMTFRTQQGDSPTIAYTYDKAGRLIASQHGHDAHRYPVDAAGNRSAASSSTPNATNQLAQLNGTRYRYDGAGNLIHREHPDGERLTLGYDGANRLVQLTHISKLGYTRHAHYRYDGLGRRINKTVRHTDGTTATTHYGWGGDLIVHQETEHQRTTVGYEPGSFVPMLRIDQRVSHNNGTAGANEEKQVSAYITDALGTPLQLLSPNGQPRWLAEPDDWAAVTKQRAVRGVTQPIRFQGQWHDEESGLYYNRHRYYDPEQGRYISQDPIGLRGGTNLYGYVTNPTGMVDPLGLFDRPGDIDQSGRRQRSNPYSRYPPAPRSTLEKVGNAGLSKVWGKVTGGVSKVDISTGAIIKSNPYVWGGWALVDPSKISTLQTRNYDGNGDGLSDEHYQHGMCVPGAR